MRVKPEEMCEKYMRNIKSYVENCYKLCEKLYPEFKEIEENIFKKCNIVRLF